MRNRHLAGVFPILLGYDEPPLSSINRPTISHWHFIVSGYTPSLTIALDIFPALFSMSNQPNQFMDQSAYYQVINQLSLIMLIKQVINQLINHFPILRHCCHALPCSVANGWQDVQFCAWLRFMAQRQDLTNEE